LDLSTNCVSRGPSMKYVTLFLANFDHPSPCHTLSHILSFYFCLSFIIFALFSIVNICKLLCVYVKGVVLNEDLKMMMIPGLPQEYISYKCDVTCSLLPPVTNGHTFSDPSPSSVTYLSLWTFP